MKCLKTGLYFHVGDKVYHCDMFGDLEKKSILLKGFAPQPTEYTGGYHATWDKDRDALVPSEKFAQFMEDWNDEFKGWELFPWTWIIDDHYCRFGTYKHHPKA